VRWLGEEATKSQKIGIPPPVLKWIDDEFFRPGKLAQFFGFLGSGSHGFIDEDYGIQQSRSRG
jgi:hypothetical protein